MREANRLKEKVKAVLVTAVSGTAMLALVHYGLLPRLGRYVSPAQRSWLRSAFLMHPFGVLLSIVALSAILSLPLLLVSLWIVRRRP